MAGKKGLGRGLDALLSEWNAQAESPQDEITLVAVEQIRPNPFQPRLTLDEESLAELQSSIEEKGILQPILVRKRDDHYELIAGERRWRAAMRSGLARVPALVREAGDTELLEIALIENIQRRNLNALEEAQAYQKLIEEHGLTQQEVSLRVGKSRVTIANMVRLNQLPDAVKHALLEDRISMGHARALLSLGDSQAMEHLCRRVLEEGLSVRETEKAATTPQRARKSKSLPSREDQAYMEDLNRRLSSLLGARVRVAHKGASGFIRIDYKNLDELDRILDRFKCV